jgi:hypothetical protein
MVEATHAPKVGKLPVPIKTKAPKAHMQQILAKISYEIDVGARVPWPIRPAVVAIATRSTTKSPSPPGAPPEEAGRGAALAAALGLRSWEGKHGAGERTPFGWELGFWCLWNVFMVHALWSENVACDGSMMSNGGSELCRA